MTRVLTAILLTGCLHAPAGMRAMTASEASAVSHLRDAYQEARGPLECSALEPDRAMVWRGTAPEVARWCGRETPSVFACVSEVNVHPFDLPPRAWVRVVEGVTWESHHSLMIHEAAHIMRGCDWSSSGRSVDVLRRGETAMCEIHTPTDHYHCDAGLWREITREAFARWAAEGWAQPDGWHPPALDSGP